MHPHGGPKSRGVDDGQHGGYFRWSFQFELLHNTYKRLLKVLTVYFSYYRLLQVTTSYLSYYKLLQVTTDYYCKVTVVTMFDMVYIGYYRLQCVYHLI